VNKEIVSKWITALRSGEYRQGVNRLCTIVNNQKSYCCLGVLCEVLDLPPGGYPIQNKTGQMSFEWKGATLITSLSADLRNNIGLTLKQQDRLIAMNDNEGASFEEIATYLEELMNNE
jgi:hypothetical protein